MFSKKIIVTILFVSLFSIKSFSQFTTTWPFSSATSLTGAKTGIQQTNVTIANVVVGDTLSANVSFSTATGISLSKSSTSNTWPMIPTNGWHLDFPVSPAAGSDVTIQSFTFSASSSNGNSSQQMLLQLAYEKDGGGSFILIGSPVTINSGGGAITYNYPSFTQKLYDGHTYKIRAFVYALTANITSKTLRIRAAFFTGIAATAGTQPSVTTTSAIKTGKYTGLATGVVTAGTLSIAESGVVWDVAANPTIAMATKNAGGPTAFGNIGAGNGGNIAGLTAATTYNARAYVISESDSVQYGANLTFTTDAPTIASLTTNAASSITSIKAISGGVILDSGGVGILAKGVCWNTATNPDISLPTKTNDGIGNSNFSSSLKILTPSTIYYARAYAVNSIGTAYGNEVSFTTLAPVPVIITTTGNSANAIPFGSVIVNNISGVKFYTLSASALTPATSGITINAPSGFEISLSLSTGFGASLNIPYTGGSIAATIIYVRFLPNKFGDFVGTITHTGGGGAAATNIDDVTVTGKGIQNPGDFSNTGTDFWVGYGFQALMTGTNNQEMVLYLSSQQDAIVTVEIGKPTDANYYIQTYNVVANTASVSFTLPKSGVQDARLNRTGILARGIHVYSNGVPFSLWEHIYALSSSGASLILPTNTWGSNYSVLTVGGKTNSGVPHSFFYVQAAEDGTIVDINPADDITATAGGTTTLYPANVPFSITLNKGDVFNALGKLLSSSIGNDLTGTTVISRDCNKKIALFTGNGRVQLFVGGCTPASGGSDNFLQQMFPKQAWGTKYLTSPFRDMEAGLYKVIVNDPTTVVIVNGSVLSGLIQNAYTIETDTLLNIVSDKPVMVAQFCASNRCNGTGIPTHPSTGNNGDPEMVIISPVQQAINDVTVYSTNSHSIQHNYVNVIIPNAGVASFMFDGVNASAAFSTHTADANYSYAVFSNLTGNTSHRLQSDIAFNAIAYGFSNTSNNESYGYNAGTNIKALNQYLSVQNTYANVSNDSVVSACLNNDFKYTVSLPYKPMSMKWDFFNTTIQLPNSDTVLVTNPIPLDSAIVGGVKLFKFGLPTTYHFTSIGTFPVNITVNATNADGCTGLQTITFSVKVVAPPTPYFLLDYYPCLPTIFNFTDSSYDKNGFRMVGREWTFYGFSPIGTATDSTPTISYFIAGSYDIKLRAINEIGCFKDTLVNVILYNGPIVSNLTANNNGPDCVGKNITFTATASASLGTIVKYYWDFGDGKKDTTTINTVSHTYTTANVAGFTVSVFVESSAGCTSGSYQINQPIHLLKAAYTLVSPQCVNTLINFTDASQGVAVTAPVTAAWLWSFGDVGNTTASTKNSSFTYTTSGTYNVKLRVSLSSGGTEFCTDSLITPLVITPTITINSVTSNPAGPGCVNKAINYIANGTTATGAFKWFWDFGDGKKDSSTTNTIAHTYAVVGSYNITVYAKLDGGCKGDDFPMVQNIFKVIAIANFNTPQCVNTSVVFTDNSTGTVFNATIDTKWEWTLAGGLPAAATSQNAAATYATTGTYNVKLKTYLVFGGNEFCSHDSTKTLVINDKLAKPVVSIDNAATTGTSLTFKWNVVSNATGYQVSTNSGTTWYTPSSGANGLTHVLTGLSQNTIYDFCVQALGNCPSDTACAEGKTTLPTLDFFVPNAFTPNGQGPNEKLVICGNNVKSIRFIVFNQWGEKIYETSNPTLNGIGCYETWDGKAFGKPQPIGTYVYVATVTLNDGKIINKKGLFSLLR